MLTLDQERLRCSGSEEEDRERCAARQGLAAGLPEALAFSLAPCLVSRGTWLCFKLCVPL